MQTFVLQVQKENNSTLLAVRRTRPGYATSPVGRKSTLRDKRSKSLLQAGDRQLEVIR